MGEHAIEPIEPIEPIDHDWSIDEREYRRHEQRRGRRHAFERLEPNRTALIVVDMIPFFVVENGYTLGIVPRINHTAALVRSRGGIVAWVVPAVGPPSAIDQEFYGPTIAERYAGSGGEGSPRERLWPALAVESEDLVVEKRSASAFFPGRCELHERLTARGVESVLIAGTVANVCCEATARDARTLGYRVVMIADANSAPTDAVLNATLHTIYRSFGDVRPAADVAELLADGESGDG